MIYLVDIDGTVADLSHRLHFIENKPANWDGFFTACPEDTPILEIINVVRALKKTFGATILMVSGRSDTVREQTRLWLDNHSIPYDGLYMRKAGDHRPDNIVKHELLEDLCRSWDRKQIAAVFEDRKQVVDMYRSAGLRVFQVAEGSF